MIRFPATGLLILALTGIDGVAAADTAQVAQKEMERAAEDVEFGDQRKRDNEKEQARETNEQARKDLRLAREEMERDGRAAETERHRAQRKARLKALIEK